MQFARSDTQEKLLLRRPVNMSNQVEDSGLQEGELSVEKQYDIQDAFVLQCSNCRVILGDSTGWVCSSEKMNVVALQKVTEYVEVSKERHIVEEGYDVGCAYDVLYCKQCKTILGKMYMTTPRLLDNMREVFTLDADKLTSYQIGCAEQISMPGLEYCFSIPTATNLEVKFNKLKAVVMSLADRIDQIENELEVPEQKSPDDVMLMGEDHDEEHGEGPEPLEAGDENSHQTEKIHLTSSGQLDKPASHTSACSENDEQETTATAEQHNTSEHRRVSLDYYCNDNSNDEDGNMPNHVNGNRDSKMYGNSDPVFGKQCKDNDSRKHKRSYSPKDEQESHALRKKKRRR